MFGNRQMPKTIRFLLIFTLLGHFDVLAQLPLEGRIVFTVLPPPQLILLKVSDRKPHHLTRDFGVSAMEPTWSPDGQKIAFTGRAHPKAPGDIYVIDVDGMNMINLTETPQMSERGPVWSPNGEWIAFLRGRDLFVMNHNGSGIRNLTNGVLWVGWSPPSWSPDSRRLVFSAVEGGQLDLFVINTDGSGLRRLLPPPAGPNRPLQFDPAFSPDGMTLAFVSVGRDGPRNTDIYLLELQGGQLRRLTHFPEYDRFPSWLPDGSGLLFVSKRDMSAIWYMRRDGTSQKPIWKGEAHQTIFTAPRLWFPRFQQVSFQGRFWTHWGAMKMP